jgi:phospholipid-translocating ATPase
LQIFPIFGASNPGLNAVPLIVILTVTAVKDAVEDWRRTVLDNELNNAPVHRLVGFNNVNTAEDQISIWRRFKKANTRAILSVWSLWKKRKSSKKDEKGKSYADRAMDESRPSIETRATSQASQRTSFHTVRSINEGEAIQMTPVPSPLPGQRSQLEEVEGSSRTNGGDLYDDIHAGPKGHQQQASGSKSVPPSRYFGNIINPFCQPADTARFKRDYWKNVQVGDYVRLYDGEEIPADLVVLSTSDADGSCYIETKNLDGETNLKVRNALHCSRSVKHARHCEMSQFKIESEAPHANLYSYSGVLKWEDRNRSDPDAPPTDMAEAITINNLLPRGSSIRNTEWVLGIALFTGQETKIMLNSGITPSKRARISKDLNWNVIYNFIILSFMCLVAGIVQGVTWGRSDTSHSLFEFGSYGDNRPAVDGFITFWAAVILFQNLVPISLYITLEIIRTLQAVFIYSDVSMYYDKIDYPCTPKSWNISDDLGQIEYIFSDKTGTLTQNVMEFKKATVNGTPYGEAYTEAMAGMQRRQGVDVEVEGAIARKQIEQDRELMLERLEKLHDNPYLRPDELTFIAPDFIADLAGDGTPEQQTANEQFLLALALCHTVIAERTGGEKPKVEFKAQSPDEAALVATARDCGYTVLGSSNEKLVVSVLGEKRYYEVLVTLEFNSTRKRMSAIIRMPNGKIMLFCKGADSMIYSRLKEGEQAELRQSTAEHLEMFAREGLRTLCIAQKELGEDEFQTWYKLHEEAANSVQDREDKLEKVADTIERDLILIGGTAIEDRLQDGVPDAIQLLGKAGIKLWVLTGDKVETAINIGFSCNLLDNEMDLIVFNIEDESLETAEAELEKNLKIFGITGSDEELKAAQTNHEPPAPTHAIVIDGESLKLVLDESLRQRFLLLCKQCKAVLCCRVSPSQKAQVVNMVKTGLDCLTLAIGDGANDVAMIQEAHVGVGIAGEEGRQAVMSSDFAIGQFRFLCRLVLVHGRWSYRRLAETIANFFYKASIPPMHTLTFTNTSAESCMDVRALLVPDFRQFRLCICVRLYLYHPLQFGFHVITGHSYGRVGPGCRRSSVLGRSPALPTWY